MSFSYYYNDELDVYNRYDAIVDFEKNNEDKMMACMLEYFYALAHTNSLTLDSGYYDPNMDSIVDFYDMIANDESMNDTTRSAYLFTNERLQGVFDNISVKDKSVLTVGSSGDQVLSSIFYGAKNIDLFDANIFAPTLIDFKIASIKALSFEEFCDFYSDFIAKFDKYYPRISSLIPDKSREFFDHIVLNGDSEHLSNFLQSSFESGDLKDIFYANNKSNYHKLKQILLEDDFNLRYNIGDFYEFPRLTYKKYDLILLSNIAEYNETEIVDPMHKKQFFNVIRDLYNNNLNYGGFIELTSRDLLGEIGENFYAMKYYPTLHSYSLKLGAKKVMIENSGMIEHDMQEGFANRSLFIQKPNINETIEDRSL